MKQTQQLICNSQYSRESSFCKAVFEPEDDCVYSAGAQQGAGRGRGAGGAPALSPDWDRGEEGRHHTGPPSLPVILEHNRIFSLSCVIVTAEFRLSRAKSVSSPGHDIK
jgi:hypothetical protein